LIRLGKEDGIGFGPVGLIVELASVCRVTSAFNGGGFGLYTGASGGRILRLKTDSLGFGGPGASGKVHVKWEASVEYLNVFTCSLG
jgi:hypothetical protein